MRHRYSIPLRIRAIRWLAAGRAFPAAFWQAFWHDDISGGERKLIIVGTAIGLLLVAYAAGCDSTATVTQIARR